MLLRRLLDRAIESIEHDDRLDTPADATIAAVGPLVRTGFVEDTLSGTGSTHPVHPAIVAVPVGAWTTANLLDLAGYGDAASYAQAVGILSALPASASGASDWLSTAGPERRVGFVHAALNASAISLHTASWVARRSGRRGLAQALGLAGTAVVAGSGWLGGHLVYAMGVGVDTTVFTRYPQEWTDAIALDDVPDVGPVSADVDGVQILLARDGDRLVALGDRCTHRGGPLSDGEVAAGCVTCPWHDSVFRLSDGAVVSGPATRPQPRLDVRVAEGRVQVRRQEGRTLRTNPVGR